MGGSSELKDLYGLVCRIVHDETIYLRHWWGQVYSNSDISNRGRVQVSIPALGFVQGSLAAGIDSTLIWASPRQGYGMFVPSVNEWVEVYFLEGDSRKPVYLTGLGEMTQAAQAATAAPPASPVPAAYTDPAKTRVLWQDIVNSDSAVYDQTDDTYTLTIGKYTLVFDAKNKVVTLTVNGNIVTIDDKNTNINVVSGAESVFLDDKNNAITIATKNGTILVDNKNTKINISYGSESILLDDSAKKITLATGGQTLVMDKNGGKTTINGNLEVDA